MTSLEQIVLPLAESRALAEAGIKLDTAMVSFNRGDDSWELVTREWALHVTRLPPFVPDIPRPVLSELLDAIYARYDNAEITMYGSGLIDGWIGKEAHQQNEDTDLIAAAALLLEVAK